MSEKTAFQKAKEQAATGGVSLPAPASGSSDGTSTALTVTPAEAEVIIAEKDRYVITPAIEEAAVQQFVLTQDMSTLRPVQQIAFIQWEKNRLGVKGHCIDLLENKKTGKVVPYYNDECATQMKHNRGASVKYTDRGFETLGDTTLFRVVCEVTKADGRTEPRTAYLDVSGLKGQELGNALMKAESKAHRRAVLKSFGLSDDSPEDGDGKLVQLEGEKEPPSIQSVFGQAGTSLIGAVQQEPVASNPSTAAQETGESPAKEEAADDAEIVTASSEAAAESPKPDMQSVESASSSDSSKTKDSATSALEKQTNITQPEAEQGKPAKGRKGAAAKESQNSSKESEAGSASTGAPATQAEVGKSSDADCASGQVKESASAEPVEDATSAGEEAAAPEDELDLDSLFSDEHEGEDDDADDAEEVEEELDPAEAAKIVTKEQMQEIFDVAKANSWTPDQVATTLRDHMKLELKGDVPRYLNVGEQRKALKWFGNKANTPGTAWAPVGEEA